MLKMYTLDKFPKLQLDTIVSTLKIVKKCIHFFTIFSVDTIVSNCNLGNLSNVYIFNISRMSINDYSIFSCTTYCNFIIDSIIHGSIYRLNSCYQRR